MKSISNVARLGIAMTVVVILSMGGRADATTHTISISSFAFSPTKTHIVHGDTVKWVLNNGGHTTTSDPSSAKSWGSPTLSTPGQSFQVVFNVADGNGPFPYHCSIHPGAMKDTIFVTSSAVEVVENSALPGDFTLEQNFPNPFNPSTTIRFSLPHTADVELTIFNVLGQTVERRDLGALHAGGYSINWDGRDEAGRSVPSGVYFYRVSAGELVETKKMLLLK